MTPQEFNYNFDLPFSHPHNQEVAARHKLTYDADFALPRDQFGYLIPRGDTPQPNGVDPLR